RSVRISRRVCVYDSTLYQLAAIESFVHDPLELTLAFRFAADFVDMFEVRGHPRERRGMLLPPELDSTEVRLAYRGLDDVVRTTPLLSGRARAVLSAARPEYPLALGPGERLQITLSVNARTRPSRAPRPLPFTDVLPRRRAPIDRLEQQAALVRAPHD